MFNGEDHKWRDWSVVFKSYAGLVNERLAAIMGPAETADPATLRNANLADDVARQASRDPFHLLLHLTTGPALDRVVNCGDGEGLTAWNRVVERYDPKLRSRSAGLLLELMRFDFAGDMLTRIEEFERSVVTFQNASGEQVSSAMKVGMVLNRLPDSELATHLVLNAERLREWSDFKSEIVNISKARAAAAGAYALGVHKSSGGGIVPMDVDAVYDGGGKGGKRGGQPWKPHWQGGGGGKGGGKGGRGGGKGDPGGKKGKGYDGKGGKPDNKGTDGKGKKGARLAGPCWRCGRPGHIARDCRAINAVDQAWDGQGQPPQDAGAADGTDAWQQPDAQQTWSQEEPEPAHALGGLWLCGLEKGITFELDMIGEETVTFGVDSGAELTVIGQRTAASYPKSGNGSMKAMRDCTGKPVEDLGAKNLVLKGPLGTTYAATTVAPVQKNLLSVAAMVDAGHEVVFRKDGSYIQNLRTGRWHSLRRVRNIYEVDFKLEPYSSAGLPPPPPPASR